ncbi:hypothetical protein EJ04DRAFT_607514 [Polyplosphaeria fusca]|uniref:Nephrocystin 3-like N-terminal domain-containing protein n=1 Tax=Polyplosphaeria fusca TaxID=682080 RepID=A0A9P4V0W5_9PLEO|nr:hypothetical protein EJ04DRAFT_607514 [Polyplosphaeria fusca]
MGAGKTIMASHIIELTQAHCVKLNAICVYYYCSYRQTENQTDAFLQWLVSQLCAHLASIPQELIQCHARNHQPSRAVLNIALSDLLFHIVRVYVIVDAVDECNTKNDLLSLFNIFARRPGFLKLQLAATSRDHSDISRVLGPISVPISMSNPLVSADITNTLEIRKALTQLPKTIDETYERILGDMSEDDKGHVRTALV